MTWRKCCNPVKGAQVPYTSSGSPYPLLRGEGSREGQLTTSSVFAFAPHPTPNCDRQAHAERTQRALPFAQAPYARAREGRLAGVPVARRRERVESGCRELSATTPHPVAEICS